MSDYAKTVRETIQQEIAELSKISWLFSRNPGKDFSRKSPLQFTKLIQSLICMGGNSIQVELLNIFHMDTKTPTTSAFVQQRHKLLPQALSFLFEQINHRYPCWKTYEGYRLLACDGSDIVYTTNAQDRDNYIATNEKNGYNLQHLNAMYDICNRRYTDAVLQNGCHKDEVGAAVAMVDRVDANQPTIFIADRNYESYNLLAHAHENGLFYLIRGKKRGIVTGCKANHLDEFDMLQTRTLSRKRTKTIQKTVPSYTYLPKSSRFDFCDLNDNVFYSLNFRVVCIKLENGELEYLLTNLPQETWSAQRLKHLYHLRWGIETAFRELKYAIGLNHFHSKKAVFISQEIFARLILHNVCEIIIVHAMTFHCAKRGKGLYQLNFTTAIQICKHFLRQTHDTPSNVIALLLKYFLPVRPDRSDPRKIKPKSSTGFLYRIA